MFVGIDIGGTNIKSVLADESGKILHTCDAVTAKTPKLINEEIVSLIDKLTLDACVDKGEIEAVGIGAAGSIDRKRGVVISSPNISCWKSYPLVARLEKILSIKVFLENDATVACAGFWFKDRKKNYKTFVMVTLGTGIGGGAVIDGRLFTGQNGSSLEIGHMTVDVNGKECNCGNRGCLEKYASATALVDYAKAHLKEYKDSSLFKRIKHDRLTAKMIYEEALQKDELAIKSFEYISFYLGAGIANIINIFNPEAVIIGGGLSNAHKLIIPAVKKIVSDRAMKGMKESVKIFAVKNQSVIPALGAAKIAMDRLSGID
ncbi:MAG: ROK family protein [Spirochaetes bacterium]|nr:ROK family protein [Spirochaetota bacterium]